MAQNEATNPKLKKLGVTIVITMIGILVILSGAYFAGLSILTDNIKSSYQSKDCEQVMKLNSLYTSLYIADKNTVKLSKECRLYLLARETEQNNDSQRTYNAYQTYKRYYPKGLFANEAEEHSALALSGLVKENLDTKEYNDALENVSLIQENFGTTKTGAHANSLIAEIYIIWIKNQRETNDFDETIKISKEFSAWAQDVNNQEYIQAAQLELAQTYLAWGEMFQSKKQFENAKAKFDLAISTDPKPSSDSGPAIQAKAAQVKLHMAWGDSFLEQDDFTNAITYYKTAVSLSDTKDQGAAQDQVAEIYLKWAANLISSEDFLGALEKVEQAKEIAATDGAKKNAETTQAEIYQAFSQSTGEQARQAMSDVAAKLCANHIRPELSIFGIDTNNIHSYLYAHPTIHGNITNEVRATTPASMHYVACLSNEKADSVTYENSRAKLNYEQMTFVTLPNGHYAVERYTILWNIKIYDLNGKLIAAKPFAGGTPLSWGDIWKAMEQSTETFATFSGTEPSLEKVSEWIKQYMK